MLHHLPYLPGMTRLYLAEYKAVHAPEFYFLESKKIDVHIAVCLTPLWLMFKA